MGTSPRVKVGSKPYPGTVFWNTQTASNLCDGGIVAEVNVFNLDSPDNACWTGLVPAVQFKATS